MNFKCFCVALSEAQSFERYLKTEKIFNSVPFRIASCIPNSRHCHFLALLAEVSVLCFVEKMITNPLCKKRESCKNEDFPKVDFVNSSESQTH